MDTFAREAERVGRFPKNFRWGYWISLIGAASLLALFVRSFVLSPVKVTGNSMEPALHDGNEVLVRKFGRIRRFDVVIFTLPDGATYVKRIIGLPGDSIAYRNDVLYVNGRAVSEKFLDDVKKQYETYTSDFSLKELTGRRTVPENQYFVLGDNRRISKDSRTIGTIREEWISGRVLADYWPAGSFRIFK